MCGISAIIGCCKSCANSTTWKRAEASVDCANARRGPDSFGSTDVSLGAGFARLGSAVLHLQGSECCKQPLTVPKADAVTTSDHASGGSGVLCWNGEVFGGIPILEDESDTQSVAIVLARAGAGLRGVERALSTVVGPFAFIWYRPDEDALYAGRDVFGRRSLLLGISRRRYNAVDNSTAPVLAILTSVAPTADVSRDFDFRELPPGGVYRISLMPMGMQAAESTVQEHASLSVVQSVCRMVYPACRCSSHAMEVQSSRIANDGGISGAEPGRTTTVTSFENLNRTESTQQSFRLDFLPWGADVQGRVGASTSTQRIDVAGRRHALGDCYHTALRLLPAPRSGGAALPLLVGRPIALAALELLRRLSAAVRVHVSAHTTVHASRTAASWQLNMLAAQSCINIASPDMHDTVDAAAIKPLFGGRPLPRDTVSESLARVASLIGPDRQGGTHAFVKSPMASTMLQTDDMLAMLPHDALQAVADSLDKYTRVHTQGTPPATSTPSDATVSPPRTLKPARVAVLYSGGVDSQLLARLVHEHVPVDEAIDLLNVDFDAKGASPDRAAAIAGVAELRALAPTRRWQLILIDESFEMGAAAQADVLHQLLQPRCGHMDFNIAAALWNAARGVGFVEVDVEAMPAAASRVHMVGVNCTHGAGDYTVQTIGSPAEMVSVWADSIRRNASAGTSSESTGVTAHGHAPSSSAAVAAMNNVVCEPRDDLNSGDAALERNCLENIQGRLAAVEITSHERVLLPAPTSSVMHGGAIRISYCAGSTAAAATSDSSGSLLQRSNRHLRYANADAATNVRADGDHKLSIFQASRKRRPPHGQPPVNVATTDVAHATGIAGAVSVEDEGETAVTPHDDVLAHASSDEIAAALCGDVEWYPRRGLHAITYGVEPAGAGTELLPPELAACVESWIASTERHIQEAQVEVDAGTSPADEKALHDAFLPQPLRYDTPGSGGDAAEDREDEEGEGSERRGRRTTEEIESHHTRGGMAEVDVGVAPLAASTLTSTMPAAGAVKKWRPPPRCAGGGINLRDGSSCGGEAARKCARRMCAPCCGATAALELTTTATTVIADALTHEAGAGAVSVSSSVHTVPSRTLQADATSPAGIRDELPAPEDPAAIPPYARRNPRSHGVYCPSHGWSRASGDEAPPKESLAQTSTFDTTPLRKRVRVLVRSAARVLITGTGADEQAAGYGRHRTAFSTGSARGAPHTGLPTVDRDCADTHARPLLRAAPVSLSVNAAEEAATASKEDAPASVLAGTPTSGGNWHALRAELALDCGRLWSRNLGRDDRVCSDSGRELRQPFVDEGVAILLRRLLPLPLVVDPRLPHGVGDKRIIRSAARLAGLTASSTLVKRAIHFGTRIAQQSNTASFGSNRAARGAAMAEHSMLQRAPRNSEALPPIVPRSIPITTPFAETIE